MSSILGQYTFIMLTGWCSNQRKHTHTALIECPLCLHENIRSFKCLDLQFESNACQEKHEMCKACFLEWVYHNTGADVSGENASVTCPTCRSKISVRL